MLTPDCRIAIVGAGAIGGVTAAFLKRAGWNPEVVCRHRETVQKARSGNFQVHGLKGEVRVRLEAVETVSDLSGQKDLVFLATKATECVQAANDLLPFLVPEGVLVSLQNGICEDALAGVIGAQRVMGCVVGWGASMHGPGDLEVTSPGEFVIGLLDGGNRGTLAFVKKLLDTIYPTRISGNIRGELYSKLIINSCINSLGVIAGVPLGRLLASRQVRNLFVTLMREAMAVAEALKIAVAPAGGGKLDYYRFVEGNDLFSSLKRHLTIRAIGFKYRRIRSSSLQSLERGRKTEIDYLNGYIVARGEETGVPTPANTAVTAMVKEIEKGRLSMGMESVESLMRLCCQS